MPVRTATHSVAVIGAGRVGRILATLLRRRGYRVTAVVSRSKQSARSVARMLAAPVASTRVEDVPAGTRVLLVAVPDESIEDVGRAIARRAPLNFSRVFVFHTSGALTSDALRAVRRRGASTASIHPMVAFPAKTSDTKQLRSMNRAVYGLEATGKGTAEGIRLIRALGGKVVRIPKQKKILYHSACVFASNYVIVLLDILEQLGKSVHSSFDRTLFRTLLEQGLREGLGSPPVSVLTGPVVRGSSNTIRSHRRSLKRWNRDAAAIYDAMGLYALNMVLSRQGLPRKQAIALRKLLMTSSGR